MPKAPAYRIASALADLAVPIGELTPYPGNARIHNDAAIAESLQVNEQYRPIVVQKSTGHILAGNGTWRAAFALGWTHIAATFIDCNDIVARRIVLADNRISDIASYDDALLAELLRDVEDFAGTGYDAAALETLLADIADSVAEPAAEPQGLPGAPVAMGPSVDVGEAVIIRQGDAADLAGIEDESVDLIVTSPPYFALRSYQDAGKHYGGQVGAEPTPQDYLESMWKCTREWKRVLKPSGSLWVNLGDKYAADTMDGSNNNGVSSSTLAGTPSVRDRKAAKGIQRPATTTVPQKSLIGVPWRYAIGCIDNLGLILRAEVIWAKPNGLPESVRDRVRRSHEHWFHFVKQASYFAAVDEIREEFARPWTPGHNGGHARKSLGDTMAGLDNAGPNPLGKLPGSVWSIATEPLRVPDELGVDHFAAFPSEWPRRIVLGWSPSGICTACGEGRRPVAQRSADGAVSTAARGGGNSRENGRPDFTHINRSAWQEGVTYAITGYACACTPHTDHPENARPGWNAEAPVDTAVAGNTYMAKDKHDRAPTREYHFDRWEPAPTRPAVVLDPFGGTGTTAMVASVLGRIGISNDLSEDYCRIAKWRTADEKQRQRVLDRTPSEEVSEYAETDWTPAEAD